MEPKHLWRHSQGRPTGGQKRHLHTVCLGLLLCGSACMPTQDSCMHASRGLLLSPPERQGCFPSHRHPKKEAAPPQRAYWPKVGRPHTVPCPAWSVGIQHSVRLCAAGSTPHSPPLSIHRGPGSSFLSEPLQLVPLLRKPTFPLPLLQGWTTGSFFRRPTDKIEVLAP